jgi:hypothetical protein
MPKSQKKCYGWRNKDGLNNDVWFLACAVNPGWTPNPVYGGNYSYPSDNGVNLAQNDYGGTPISITPLNSQSEIDAWLKGATAQGSCACLAPSTDDDCPEGSHKCTHKKYPGYCCVPCKEVADRINSIAKKIK